MYIYKSLDAIFPLESSILAIGTFDGMHLAHRYLVEKVCQEAVSAGETSSVVVSFSSHPKNTLDNACKHKVLTTKDEKINILGKIGVNHLAILDFSPEIADISYTDFIRILKKRIGIKKIILGYNHHFGKNREGCYETLLPLGKELDFEVESIEKQTIDGMLISSSSIRDALLSGDVVTANKILGYNYSVRMWERHDLTDEPDAFFFDSNKIIPKNGRYTAKINEEKLNQLDFIFSIAPKESIVYRMEFLK